MKKNTASRDTFILYTGFSLLLSLLSIYSDDIRVAFDYDIYFADGGYAFYFVIIVGFGFSFALGYKSKKGARPVMESKAEVRIYAPKVKKEIVISACVAQFLIVSYFIFKMQYAINNGGYLSSDDERILGGKEAYVLLLIQSLIPIIIWRVGYLRIISISACVGVGFVFSWVDSSRAGAISLASVMIFSALSNRRMLLMALVLIQSFFLLLSIVGRTLSQRVSLEFFNSFFLAAKESWLELTLNTISYITAFSHMHFAYVVETGSGQFNIFDLIYSITPVPSFAWPFTFDTDLWRVDQFRPMGAVAELYRVSPLLAFLYFWFIGRLAKSNDLIGLQSVRVIQIVIFFLICVTSYQYSLRTVQWYIYCSVIINFYTSNLGGKRQVGGG